MTQKFIRPSVASGVTPFSWAYWRALHGGFKSSGWRSQERWQLAYLHSTDTLNEIAEAVRDGFMAASKAAMVSVQSIWIDGTPQVTGFLPDGRALAGCELADLLFIVNQISPSGLVTRRTGLLLQGKTAKRHNRLPSNPSTKKERLLLEGLDRARALSVFKDIGLKSPIGAYTFGGAAGLEDCARYLMMAKTIQWSCPICTPLAPLQTGWPKSRQAPSLEPTTSFLDMLRGLATTSGVGRQIQDKGAAPNCEWSRLVWDLLDGYAPVEMQGYGGQQRVNASQQFSCFVSGAGFSGAPPHLAPIAWEVDRRPPAISVIQVNIRSEWSKRETEEQRDARG